ncbi:cysteine desulfurase family protein [Methylocaldum szegediense]|uniref:cysteine desulfurase n=1 Tax=Methylocaldum szegediense TaxID=73780 RepID=A0ABM9I8P9_9GAMM|nr:aminotransferase class V-fold PLP-dependent enzyme [Methylocaldum szegediense]CAI8962691.1 Cysteine desulfurase [Methylocaldum szegediense]
MSDAIVYLDNNATTVVAPECIEAMVHCLRETYGNPSSKHGIGESAKVETIAARSKVAALLGATPPEIVFTSGGTESNHQAILGGLALSPGKRHIVTSQVEHPSTLALMRHLESQGVQVSYLPVDSHGRLDLEDLERAITEDTALVSLMWANNETGVLFPIEDAVAIARTKGVLFHTDAVQAVGKTPIDLARVPVDFLSFSSHKIHGPKGIGVLFVRKGRKLPPLLFGHQERGRRGSTENVPGMVALGVAAELAAAGLASSGPRIGALRDRLENELLALIPGAFVNGAGAERVANTTSLCLGTIEAEPILDKLDRAGICASAGAACTASGTEPSHVLTAMGRSAEAALATIRFSLSRYTTEEEIDRVIEVLPGIVRTFRAEAA